MSKEHKATIMNKKTKLSHLFKTGVRFTKVKTAILVLNGSFQSESLLEEKIRIGMLGESQP